MHRAPLLVALLTVVFLTAGLWPRGAGAQDAPVTGNAALDTVLELLARHAFDDLADSAVLRDRPWALDPHIGPACPAGVAPGTPVASFAIPSCETEYPATEAEIVEQFAAILGPGPSSSIYAVVRGGPSAEIAFSVIVTPGRVPSHDAIASVWLLDADAGIRAVERPCGEGRPARGVLAADYPGLGRLVAPPPDTNPSPPPGGVPPSAPFAGAPGPHIDRPSAGTVAVPNTGSGWSTSGTSPNPGAAMTLFAGIAVMADGLRRR